MIYKVIFIILASFLLAIYGLSLTSRPPRNLGLNEGRLSLCPESPNCVSSQATDNDHKIKAITASGDTKKVMDRVAAAVTEMGGSIRTIDGPYLHAVFRSKVFRFPDDLECHYNKSEGLIEVRSAARLGYSDFSVNRQRVETLRQKLSEK